MSRWPVGVFAAMLATAGMRAVLAADTSTSTNGSFVLGEPFVLYDTAVDRTSDCKPFLNSQVVPMSLSGKSGTIVEFPTVDFRGQNFLVAGSLSAEGALSPFHVNCRRVFKSALNTSFDAFDGSAWIIGLYKASDDTIVGVVHSEYYGGDFPQNGEPFEKSDKCPSGEPLSCTYAAVTEVESTDGALTFHKIGERPDDYVVARPSFPYSATYNRPTGVFINSNIVGNVDGYYYMLVVLDMPNSAVVDCVVRTVDLRRPSLWRAWDGSGYSISTPKGEDCRGLNIDIAPFYIARSTYFGRFIAIGTKLSSPYHFAYSLSGDLVNWSDPVDLGIAPQWALGKGAAADWGNYNYPSLMDASALQNIGDQNASSGALVGQAPLLLYIDRKGDNSATRLMAQRLTFQK